jgi:hypothetical protein
VTTTETPILSRGVVDADGGEAGFAYEDATVAVDADATDRSVIRNASLQLHAADTRETFDRIISLIESKGGFVASAEVLPTVGEDHQPEITMVLRIPAEDLSTTMRSTKELADEVVSESQSAQDVSEQFVDLEARLTNLEALETELRALLTDVRAQPDADPAKLLQVFNELASVRGQIEQIEGQLEYLSNLTELASLQVSVTQTPAAIPVVEEPWAPGETVRDATRDLVNALQAMTDAMIAFVITTLPVLMLILIGPAILGYLVYRRWWKGRVATSAPATS